MDPIKDNPFYNQEHEWLKLAEGITGTLMAFASARNREHLDYLSRKLDIGIPLSDAISSGLISGVTDAGLTTLRRTWEIIYYAVEYRNYHPTCTPADMWEHAIQVKG